MGKPAIRGSGQVTSCRDANSDCRVLLGGKTHGKKVSIYQVDAFTDVPFGGNPAGVVPDARGLSDETMQKIAREMNLSETAFIIDVRKDKQGGNHTCQIHRTNESRESQGSQGKGAQAGRGASGEETAGPRPDFKVRFFTPLSEVDLCGHATIGSYWLLTELGIIKAEEGEVRVYQETKAGLLPVDIVMGCEGMPSRVMMTQRVPEIVGQPTYEELSELERILSAPRGCITDFDKSKPQVVSTGLPDLIVPVTSREALLSMRPNMGLLSDFCRARNIISVHCFSLETLDPAATVHCRDFSPVVGVPEESATGTASGATGAYLVLNKLVKVEEPVTRIVCEQGHILKRPSIIHVEVTTEGERIVSVRVGGSAVTVTEGQVRVE